MIDIPAPAIGRPIERFDATQKVRGTAKYSAEIALPHLAYAVVVGSSIAKGRITHLDTAAAEQAPGVIKVLTHENAMRIKKPKDIFNPGDNPPKPTNTVSSVLPLQGNEIFFRGQLIAAVVAETVEQAQAAATLLRVTYAEEEPTVDFLANLPHGVVPKNIWGEASTIEHGDAEGALREAAAKVDEIYQTPLQNHHPMEMESTTIEWRGDELFVYQPSRHVKGVQRMFAQSFDFPEEKIHVLSQFVGGAFGSKGPVRPHVALAGMCARQTNRPVKLLLTRRQTTTASGHRPPTRQRVALGASADGRLQAIIHEGFSACSATDPYVEPFTVSTHGLYAAANRRFHQELVFLNTSQPQTMRAPGESPGMFALESAMDELAHQLQLDPLELRRRNEPATEPMTGKPFSNRHLLRCIELGAARFGWDRRSPVPGAVREGNVFIGYGYATTVYPTKGGPCQARCRLYADGRIVVSSATHEFGNGFSTVARQIAADALGVQYDQITFEYGNSDLPPAMQSGGSTTTMWVGSAVKEACTQAQEQVAALARGEAAPSFAAVLQRHHRPFVEATAEAKPDAETKKQYALDSYGAHFAEVAIDADTGTVRVRRFVSVLNCGRVMNPQLAQSQLQAAIIWGLGQALTEENQLDPRTGQWLNATLADYHLPTFADTPDIDVSWLDEPDELVNPLGAKGIGEICVVGTAAAIANAVFNATGKRVRDLPITPDKLLAAT